MIPTSPIRRSGAGKLWLPRALGATLQLRDETEYLTFSEASINADLTTWTRANVGVPVAAADPLGGNGAFTITDTVDASPVAHAYSKALVNYATGPATLRFWLKADGGSNWMRYGTENASVGICTDGSVGLAVGAISAVKLQSTAWGHEFLATLNDTVSTNGYLWFSEGATGGTLLYQGTGARSAVVYYPTGALTQQRARTIRDRLGSALTAEQATAAYQPHWVTDADGKKAMLFAGDSDKLVIASGVAPNDAAEFTLGLWVRDTATSAATRRLLYAWDSAAYRFVITRATTGNLYFYAATSPTVTGSNYVAFSGPSVRSDWNHMCFGYKGAAGPSNADKVKCWINGSPIVSVANAGTIPATIAVAACNWYLGAISQTSTGDCWEGSLDDLTYFPKLLSDDEAARLYSYYRRG